MLGVKLNGLFRDLKIYQSCLAATSSASSAAFATAAAEGAEAGPASDGLHGPVFCLGGLTHGLEGQVVS